MLLQLNFLNKLNLTMMYALIESHDGCILKHYCRPIDCGWPIAGAAIAHRELAFETGAPQIVEPAAALGEAVTAGNRVEGVFWPEPLCRHLSPSGRRTRSSWISRGRFFRSGVDEAGKARQAQGLWKPQRKDKSACAWVK